MSTVATDRDTTAQAQADLAWLERNGGITGVAMILAERRLQIEQLGYGLEHDHRHPVGHLATDATLRLAGAAYMTRYDTQPRDARPELAKAAALAAAEIDQLSWDDQAGERQQRWGG